MEQPMRLLHSLYFLRMPHTWSVLAFNVLLFCIVSVTLLSSWLCEGEEENKRQWKSEWNTEVEKEEGLWFLLLNIHREQRRHSPQSYITHTHTRRNRERRVKKGWTDRPALLIQLSDLWYARWYGTLMSV
jgi:hypothetical protein